MVYISVTSLIIFLVVIASSGTATPQYKPKVPSGYSSRILLHVDYGITPGKIRVQWESGPDEEYVEEASVEGMRIVGNRVYFIDAVAHTVKQYLPPGKLMWETKRLENLTWYAVGAGGRVYAIWGAAVSKLSCIDRNGAVIWTREYEDIVKTDLLKDCGLRSTFGQFRGVESTPYGMTVNITGNDEHGEQLTKGVVIDENGKALKVLPGFIVASDGRVYSRKVSGNLEESLSRPLVGSSLEGNVERVVHLDYRADRGKYLKGVTGIGRFNADPAGGFIVDSIARLSTPVRLSSRLTANVEDVLWRFDLSGRLREQWRFPNGGFGSRYRQVVVGDDGNVYHLRFGERGIDVIKYYRQAK